MAQNNLGFTLLRLGERAGDVARLEEAVAPLRAALEEYTRESVPVDWARAQNNLGLALVQIGKQIGSVSYLEQALESFNSVRETYEAAEHTEHASYLRDYFIPHLEQLIAESRAPDPS